MTHAGPLDPLARLEVLSRMKSLPDAKERLGSWAIVLATKHRFMQPDPVVLKLTGRVLETYLDPLCHHCDGRGFSGGSHRGEMQVLCRPCGGTGHRRGQIGKTDEERQFAGLMWNSIESAIGGAMGNLRKNLPRVDAAKAHIEQARKRP